MIPYSFPNTYNFCNPDNPFGFRLQMISNQKVTSTQNIGGINTYYTEKPDSSAVLDMKIGSRLRDYLDYQLPNLAITNNLVNSYNTSVMKAFAYTFSQPGDTNYNSTAYYAILGMASVQDYANNAIFKPVTVLTKQPPVKYISRTGRQFVSIFTTTNTTVNVYIDGVLFTSIPTTANQINIFELSPSTLGISSNVDKYKVSFDNGGYSITFKIMPVPAYQNKEYLFVNSMGQYETITLRGSIEKTTQKDQLTAQNWIPKGYATSFGREQVFDTRISSTYKVSTGYYNNDMLDYIANEFFTSPRIYEVFSNTDIRPVQILSKKADSKIENFMPNAVTLEMKYL